MIDLDSDKDGVKNLRIFMINNFELRFSGGKTKQRAKQVAVSIIIIFLIVFISVELVRGLRSYMIQSRFVRKPRVVKLYEPLLQILLII